MSNIVVHSLPSLKLARSRSEIATNYEEIKAPMFLKTYAKNKTYYIYTHGCQANYRDSEIYKGILELDGFKPANTIDSANIIIINTCAVRENAENKVLGEIGNLKKLKSKNDVTLIIAGCMAMEEIIVQNLIKTFFHVDIIIGTNNIYRLNDLLIEHLKTNKRIVEVNSDNMNIHECLPSVRDSDFKAYVNIMYGCDKFCTYCIVPYTRGRERSRASKDIISECQELVNKGYQEITLLGQNVDSYGKDLKDGSNFATLLDEVAKLNIPRLSFLTSHPYDFSLDIIRVMKVHSNIEPYLHLPLQSGDNHILKLMGRKYSVEDYLYIIKNARTIMPNLFISTDIIVGFPNETEEEFNHTLDICKEVNYDGAFTFIYSKRNGTPAARLLDSVTNDIKVKRFKMLTDVLNKTIEEHNKKYLNQIYDVLVDAVSKNNPHALSGRLMNNKMVNFNGPIDLIGKIVKVKITSTHIHYLIGEVVQ